MRRRNPEQHEPSIALVDQWGDLQLANDTRNFLENGYEYYHPTHGIRKESLTLVALRITPLAGDLNHLYLTSVMTPSEIGHVDLDSQRLVKTLPEGNDLYESKLPDGYLNAVQVLQSRFSENSMVAKLVSHMREEFGDLAFAHYHDIMLHVNNGAIQGVEVYFDNENLIGDDLFESLFMTIANFVSLNVRLTYINPREILRMSKGSSLKFKVTFLNDSLD